MKLFHLINKDKMIESEYHEFAIPNELTDLGILHSICKPHRKISWLGGQVVWHHELNEASWKFTQLFLNLMDWVHEAVMICVTHELLYHYSRLLEQVYPILAASLCERLEFYTSLEWILETALWCRKRIPTFSDPTLVECETGSLFFWLHLS